MKHNGSEMVLESASEEKDLGVWIDEKLKFTNHVEIGRASCRERV